MEYRQKVEADLGYEVTQSTRTTLNDVVDDEIRLRTAVRQEAPSQRIEVGSDAGYRTTLDAHELSTRGTALVGLRRLAPELDLITASHTKVTARQGQQIETAIVDLEIDLSIRAVGVRPAGCGLGGTQVVAGTPLGPRGS